MYISPFLAVFIAVAIYVWTNWDAPEYNGDSHDGYDIGRQHANADHKPRVPPVYVWATLCITYMLFVICYSLIK